MAEIWDFFDGQAEQGSAMSNSPTVYIGFDRCEPQATEVARRSLLTNTSATPEIRDLQESEMRKRCIYDRPYRTAGAQRIDIRDGKHFATDFSFTRFLVPTLNKYKGWALYCDAFFLFRADVQELFALCDDKYAVMCVKHDHRPKERTKMEDQRQEVYQRKNWSSLMLFNCGHKANAELTIEMVNYSRGAFLHGFGWLEDRLIGGLPESWNALDGWSAPEAEPKAVNMTRGIPTMSGCDDIDYADEWRAYLTKGAKERAARVA